ncbi:MAG: hypothetical protein CVU13_00305 [Bacteroidetes bacterium HGW-Bacteroidetes-8]|jgi:hypothetical protein|nr:MAG: hypothetical protein CVU13_00305 [Bacteroidetes bacterium HGW-Bacteroidetes-8]
MDKKTLIESAKSLNNVSTNSVKEYIDKSDRLVAEINRSMISREDIVNLIGKDNIAMMKDNHSNHVRFIASILGNRNDEVFVETVLWVFRAYRSHNFTTSYWAAQLNAWIEIIKKELSPQAYCEIYPYYEWMQLNIPLFVYFSDEKLDALKSKH